MTPSKGIMKVIRNSLNKRETNNNNNNSNNNNNDDNNNNNKKQLPSVQIRTKPKPERILEKEQNALKKTN